MGLINKKELFILIFIIGSASYITFVSFTQPYLGIELENNENEWIVSHINGDSWAEEQNIPLGAEVELVNGEVPEDHYSVSMFHNIENAESFRLQMDGETLSYNGIEQTSATHWLFFVVIPLLFLLGVLWISHLVYKKVDPRYSVHLLMLYFLTIGLGYISNSGAVRDNLYSVFLNTFLFLIACVILIHFLYKYFAELGIYWFSKKWYLSLYWLVGLVTLTEPIFLLNGEYPSFIYHVSRILLLILYSILFFIIYRGLYLHKDDSYGTLFKYVSVGMTIAFLPYISLYLIPALTLGVKFIPLEFAASFLIALPVTFMYLVTREQLIDINFYMGRLRYYVFLSVLPSLIITICLSFLLDLSMSFFIYVEIFILINVTLIIFLSIKEVLDFKLQQYLFAARYSYQESMHRMSKNMKDQTNAVDLMKVLRNEISSVLNVRDIYIYSKHNKKKLYCVYDPIPEDILAHFEDHFSNHRYDIGSIIETEKGFGVIVGYSLEKITMLWCRGKKDFTTLNRDEKTYLQTISHNANIAIENMNLIEDLLKELRTLRSDQTQQYPAWLSRLLFSIAENQRKQLSIDLHDTVLQEQLYLYRRMDDLIGKRKDLPKTLGSELSMFKESILDSIHLIRETCNELRPAFIEELGLVHALEDLIEQYQLRSNFTVYFSHEGFRADLDQERILAIFRIVQELLSNAMKHSEAKIVKLSLRNNKHGVTLIYSDDGQGMDYSFQRDLFSHIGLSGIEQRVHGLNGSLTIDTSPGKGFKSTISFPFTVSKEVTV
ncbi:sensor histidine kinase [Halobacillus sp. A5]|uniref:sensor histidine kinase n=1 Tax=Halobacillus sp. A5 TaxID=2880263 RepID=UPI0020A65EEC|nr:sensor histidine kinase [Halobacillus sp. A5]MCP3025507.1 sensor histidine kinase [Halobacillus sp. A5]